MGFYESKENQPFLLIVKEKHGIMGRVIISGKVERGILQEGDEIEILGPENERHLATVSSIEVPFKYLGKALPGDIANIMLSGIRITDIDQVHLLAAPGSLDPHTKFRATIEICPLAIDFHPEPIAQGSQQQFCFEPVNVTGTIRLPAGIDVCKPEETLEVSIELTDPVFLGKGRSFSILERLNDKAYGTVTEILD